MNPKHRFIQLKTKQKFTVLNSNSSSKQASPWERDAEVDQDQIKEILTFLKTQVARSNQPAESPISTHVISD